MQVIKTRRFDDEFLEIYKFIAKDSEVNADNFREELDLKLESLSTFPYKYRKSSSQNDKNLRDLIFKGYVIPYKIYEDKILIIGIFNQNRWSLD